MLDKSICKKCYDSYGKYVEKFEDYWDRESVLCPGGEAFDIRIAYVPDVPSWCPYALEHLMKEQKDAKQRDL